MLFTSPIIRNVLMKKNKRTRETTESVYLHNLASGFCFRLFAVLISRRFVGLVAGVACAGYRECHDISRTVVTS